MPRGLGLIIFGGLGYLLLYAAIANGGRFATHPWAGLQEDAYTGDRSTATGSDANAPTIAEPVFPGTTKPGATLVAGRSKTARPRQTGSLV